MYNIFDDQCRKLMTVEEEVVLFMLDRGIISLNCHSVTNLTCNI